MVDLDEEEVKRLIGRLSAEFPMRDLGALDFFLGVQIKHLKEGLHMSQTQYLVNLLQSCGMENLKLASTPMLADIDLRSEEPVIQNVREFR